MNNQKEINGRNYSIGNIPPTRALYIQVELAKVLGGGLFTILAKGKSSTESLEAGALAISTALSSLDDEKLLKMMTIVFEHMSINGQRINIDADFVGRPKDLWLAFWAGLQYNFKDFLPESLFGLLQTKIASALSQSNPPT